MAPRVPTPRRWIAGATLGLAIAASIASGCGSSDSSSGGSSDSGDTGDITIGAPIALTSDLSSYDIPALEGAKLAAEEINARGGLLGGRRLKFVTSDTGGNPAQGQTAALEVIDKGAQFLMTSLDYDKGSPAARTAESRGLVSLSMAGDPRYGAKGIGRHFFNVFSGGTTEGAAAAQFAHDEGWKRVYLLEDVSINYGKTFCRYFDESFRRLADGATIVGRDTFQNTDKSVSTQVARLRAAGDVDAVVLCSYPPGGATALKQIRGGGIDVPVLGGVPFDGNFWIAGVPDERNFYALATGLVDGRDPDPQRRRVLAAYARATGRPAPAGLAPLTGYSIVQALGEAIERAGSTDGDAVAAALETFRDQPLAIGPTTWTPECHIAVGRPFVITKLVDGTLEYVGEAKPEWVPPALC
ncbi:ABC transporter substrate-binding protein [Conexibacter woesei]|uniref:Extracellular ligand-binding receptor n=1 Tax=Conexibacter woesei (strain DSM 14684 / CCUG 47730 / CIP 108061 / JCM 11494 / NBRC 100937 / ID131577) TaxID=469383 RepID=D3FAP9_CONWI|nr:ABC transporter substrate-binding protein [Conexibacter woesei]ADB51212.1 Extracellular ligand-binding receptor [Conexibacter woesei DSM 14684]